MDFQYFPDIFSVSIREEILSIRNRKFSIRYQFGLKNYLFGINSETNFINSVSEIINSANFQKLSESLIDNVYLFGINSVIFSKLSKDCLIVTIDSDSRHVRTMGIKGKRLEVLMNLPLFC